MKSKARCRSLHPAVERGANLHDPFVTTLEPLEAFYVAEEYHQELRGRRNPNQPYVATSRWPKVEKRARISQSGSRRELILGACSATDHGFLRRPLP